MKLKEFVLIVALQLFLLGCDLKMTKNDEIIQAMGEVTDKDLYPYYPTVYTADSVELEEMERLIALDSIDQWTCLSILSNSCKELKADYNNYMLYNYNTVKPANNDERLSYVEIGNISNFIVRKFKTKETECLAKIFENAEIILQKGDETTKSLIVVGLFEGVQNVAGWHKVDYYNGFDKWLYPESKVVWDKLIKSWEGKRK